MVKVLEVGKPYDVESQYSNDVTSMVTVVLVGASPSTRNSNASLLGEVDGIDDLSLGGQRQLSLAIRAEHADRYPEGRKIDGLFICREWTDENPYPNAVDKNGDPIAQPMEITHPEHGDIAVYSRTFLSKERLADTWNLTGEYGDDALLNAPPVESKVPAKTPARRQTARK